MLALPASLRFVRTLQPRRLLTSLPHVVEHDGTLAERSLILLKPDAVERRLVGRILSRFEDRGLAIVALRQRMCDRALAEKKVRKRMVERQERNHNTAAAVLASRLDDERAATNARAANAE